MSDNNELPSTPLAYALLHFDLDDDDGEGERRLRECLDAPKVLRAVEDYTLWLRNRIKYGGEDDADEKLTEAWNKLFKCFEDSGVRIPGFE